MQEENWVDKQFELERSLEELPLLLQRLAGVPSEIEKIVIGLPSPLLTAQVDGAWSVHQHIGHLADLEELHEARLGDFEVRAATLRPADMTNRKTEEAHHNDAPIDELLATFQKVRTQFVQRLAGMSDVSLAHSAMHPRLQKPMRPVDLAYFVTEHDAHHVAAIARLCGRAEG